MYCATCGTLIDESLNYCNRCGNRVVKNELTMRGGSDVSGSVLKSLSIATGFVGVIGLSGLFALIAILLANRAGGPDAIFLALLFAATVFGVCFLLTRQISRLSSAGGADFSEKRKFKQTGEPEQLNPVDAATQFQPLERPFRSVTENTTRTLDKNKV